MRCRVRAVFTSSPAANPIRTLEDDLVDGGLLKTNQITEIRASARTPGRIPPQIRGQLCCAQQLTRIVRTGDDLSQIMLRPRQRLTSDSET